MIEIIHPQKQWFIVLFDVCLKRMKWKKERERKREREREGGGGIMQYEQQLFVKSWLMFLFLSIHTPLMFTYLSARASVTRTVNRKHSFHGNTSSPNRAVVILQLLWCKTHPSHKKKKKINSHSSIQWLLLRRHSFHLLTVVSYGNQNHVWYQVLNTVFARI